MLTLENYRNTIAEMITATQSGVEDAARFAMGYLIDVFGANLAEEQEVREFAEKIGAMRDEKYSSVLVEEMNERGFDTSYMGVYDPTEYGYSLQKGGQTVGFYNSEVEAKNAKKAMYGENSDWQIVKNKKYASGGLVDYTGPAWADGTERKPEAFLSPEDTERIGNAARLLSNLPLLNNTKNITNNSVASNVGDTSIEIHINVENITSDYDVDQMIERVKKDIVDVANPIGSSIIMKKR